ncbi:MAG: Uma2 family endonuclease [Xanthomonadales bacterium]|nr:Uma2 family endonuclease [Xanthomonadales bacterium]
MAHGQPRSGEFCYADYLAWPEGERWQLLDGHAYAVAPPSTAHQRVVFELGRQIGNQPQGKPCQGFSAPMGVRLPGGDEADEDIRTVFEPDLLVVCDASRIDARGVRGAPDFIIEVLSPSTAAFDLVDKRQRYERAGVGELWLIDPVSSVLTVYRREGEQFTAADIRVGQGRLAVQSVPGLVLELDLLQSLRIAEQAAAYEACEAFVA